MTETGGNRSMTSSRTQGTPSFGMHLVARLVPIAIAIAIVVLVVSSTSVHAASRGSGAGERTCQADHPKSKMLLVSGSELDQAKQNGGHRYSDGSLTVDLENFDGDSLDWRSNKNVLGVFLGVGGAGSTYNYDPPVKADVGLTAAGPIDAISFCYKSKSSGNTAATPTTDPSPEATPPSGDGSPTPAATGHPQAPDTAVASNRSAPPPTGRLGIIAFLIVIALTVLAVVRSALRNGPVREPVSVRNDIWSTKRDDL
jgi:hypothetical protein